MKITNRILWILPFIAATFFYIKFQLNEEGCGGLIEIAVGLTLLVSLLVTGTFALVSCFRRRQLHRLKFEPITLIIFLLTVFTNIFFRFSNVNFKSETQLYAQNELRVFFRDNLELRADKTYRAQLKGMEVNCNFIGTYSIVDDTIFLNNDISRLTDKIFVAKYLHKGSKLIPIINSADSSNNTITLEVESPE